MWAPALDAGAKVLSFFGNEVVKRNMKRFEGDDFMFRLTKDEADYARSRSQIATLNDGGSTDPSSLRSQFATSNKGRGGVRYLPYSFTELGVARYRPH